MAAAPDPIVEAARTRARRRLFGAVVLLAIGIVAFPVLFDTRPRPLALDTPIEIAQREPDPALARRGGALPDKPLPVEQIEPPRERAATPGMTVPPDASAPSSTVGDVPTRTAPLPAPAPVPLSPPVASVPLREPEPGSKQEPVVSAPATAPATTPATAPVIAPVIAPPATPTPKPTPTPTPMSTDAVRADDGARARALLEGRPPPSPTTAAPTTDPAAAPAGERYIVQVGAYTEDASLRDARSRVERLGMKTYTQVVGNEAGRRTRVRVGPFTNRGEADAAAARLKRSGLPASVLTL